MAPSNIRRILVYTHNSIGLGHAFRTLAVLTGIKHWRPEIDFLVLSGTSVPHVFHRAGIEVIKLPSVKMEIGPEGQRLQPRYLNTFRLENLFDVRQRLISQTFDFFEPDVLMIEHNMTGQMNELIHLQLRKWMRRGGPLDFAMVYLCRGIMSRGPLLRIPYQNPRHRSEWVNIGQLFDFMYVLEERDFIDVNREFLGNDSELEDKIRYLGRITNKTSAELPPREQVLRRLRLADRGIVLLTLGRHGQLPELAGRILEALERTGIKDKYQILLALDPYLDRQTVETLRNHPLAGEVIFLPFEPELGDLISVADLVICRAGYNTINEILLGDTRAVVIPEDHAGGEQELRAQRMPQENVTVASESEIINGRTEELLLEILNRKVTPLGYNFDKYAIGRAILDDLEAWKARETS